MCCMIVVLCRVIMLRAAIRASTTFICVKDEQSPRPDISFVAFQWAHYRIECIRRVSWVRLWTLAFSCAAFKHQSSFLSFPDLYIYLSQILLLHSVFLLPQSLRHLNPPPDPANQPTQFRPEKLRTSRYSTHLPTARHATEVMFLSRESSGGLSTGA